MGIVPTEDIDLDWIPINIGLIADMSPAQERVIRSIASGLGYEDLRSYRAYLRDIGMSYYETIRMLYE